MIRPPISRLTLVAVVVATIAGAASCRRAPAVAAMPVEGLVRVALGTNYSYMSLAVHSGSSLNYGEYLDDTATMAVTGMPFARGKAQVATQFAAIGPQIGAIAFAREITGFAVNGRLVRDSGTYEFIRDSANKAKPPIDMKGRYYTLWRLTDDGHWKIVADTLIGEKHTRADLPHAP